MKPSEIETQEDLHAVDQELIADYSVQMLLEGANWYMRQPRLRIARKFLRWVREQGHDRICALAYGHRSDSPAEWELRELFLRQTCPDREIRAEERDLLNGFLNYLSSIETLQLS